MTVGELVVNGGWAMVPIYLCSAVAVAIFFKKIMEFRSRRLGDISWLGGVLEALENSEIDEARRRARQAQHPVGPVVDTMLDTLKRRPDRVEAEAKRVGSLQLQQLEKNVGGLSFVAQAAPLLGLLGTVIGMVELFMSLQGTGTAAVDAALLASGIWKALLTTAAGLTVAVPALAAYAYLNSRTDRFRLTLQDAIERVLTALPGPEEPVEKPRPRVVEEAADAI